MFTKNRAVALLALSAVFLLGLHMRCESVANTPVIDPLRADARDYFVYAYNLRHNHVYSRDPSTLEDPSAVVNPDAVRSPGYPLFLSLFLQGPPTNEVLARILLTQAFLSSLTIVIAFLVHRAFLPFYWCIGAALLTALSPHLIVANSYMLTETLFCLLVVLSVWTARLFFITESAWLIALSGIVLGMGSLVRPVLQYFPLILVFFLIGTYGWKKGARFSLALSIGFILILAPWIVRNLAVLHKMGDNRLMIDFLHHGVYPNFTYNEEPRSYGFPYRFDPRSEEISASLANVLMESARRFAEQPAKHLRWFLIGKSVAFWSWNIVQGMGDAFVYPVSNSPYFDSPLFQWTHRLMRLTHWPLVCLGFLASLWVWLPGARQILTIDLRTARLVSLLLIYFTTLHILGAPFPRYSIPLRPLLYGIALLLPSLIASHRRASSSLPRVWRPFD